MEYTLEQLIVEWEAQIVSMKYYNYNPEIIEKNKQILSYFQELKEYRDGNRA